MARRLLFLLLQLLPSLLPAVLIPRHNQHKKHTILPISPTHNQPASSPSSSITTDATTTASSTDAAPLTTEKPLLFPDLKPYDKKLARKQGYKTFCFHDNEAGERGTQVAMYDYAEFAEKFFHVKSKIFFANDSLRLQPKPLKHFMDRFPVIIYPMEDPSSKPVGGRYMLKALLEEKCDFFYVIKAGSEASQPSLENLAPEVVPMGVHAVFDWQPHMSSYAAISPEVIPSRVNESMIVPHIVRPVEDWAKYLQLPDLRQSLNISRSSLVVCRHGGFKTFDVHFVQTLVLDLLASPDHPDLHFLFVNTKPLPATHRSGSRGIDAHRLHQLPMIVGLQEKERYFRTCNLMLHAREKGETFGLSVAEMSVHNIPVLTYPGQARVHVRILGTKGFVYQSPETLRRLLQTFYDERERWIGLAAKGPPVPGSADDFNAYRDYEPEKVMRLFKTFFLDPIFH